MIFTTSISVTTTFLILVCQTSFVVVKKHCLGINLDIKYIVELFYHFRELSNQTSLGFNFDHLKDLYAILNLFE